MKYFNTLYLFILFSDEIKPKSETIYRNEYQVRNELTTPTPVAVEYDKQALKAQIRRGCVLPLFYVAFWLFCNAKCAYMVFDTNILIM